MRFRVYTVAPADFDRWVARQREPAAFGAAAGAAATPVPATPTPGVAAASAPGGAGGAQPSSAQPPSTQPAIAQPPVAAPTADGYEFPRDRVPPHIMPRTPIPAGLTFPENLLAAGDAQRGMETYSRSACIGCHRIRGNRTSVGTTGPDLTHIASRLTIAAGLYPNDARHLALWIKNARRMKPMTSMLSMPTLGRDQVDPVTKMRMTTGGLTDEQIADIVAYLMALK
jgi:cytochrome c oxidase subunit 2